MRKLFFFSTVLAVAAAVASCTIETRDSVVVPVSDGEPVTLQVGVSTARTKVTDMSGDSEEKVNTLQVFVFSEGGNGLEKSVYEEDSKSVHLTCFPGMKEVVAIVNAEEIDWTEITEVDDLAKKVIPLTDNSLDSFLMYGRVTANVAANEFVDVEVARRVARVVLKSVTNAITPESAVGLFKMESVYLINVAAETCFDGTCVTKKWYNGSGLDDFEVGEAPYDFLYDKIGDFSFEEGEQYQTAHTFYCYPNLTSGDESDGGDETDEADETDGADESDEVSAPAATRLVLQATLNGTQWYYPVTLKNVRPNYSYEIDLKITGAGASSPDTDPQIDSYEFTISVAGWVVEPIEAEI